jgi:hypothetical protein
MQPVEFNKLARRHAAGALIEVVLALAFVSLLIVGVWGVSILIGSI